MDADFCIRVARVLSVFEIWGQTGRFLHRELGREYVPSVPKFSFPTKWAANVSKQLEPAPYFVSSGGWRILIYAFCLQPPKDGCSTLRGVCRMRKRECRAARALVLSSLKTN